MSMLFIKLLIAHLLGDFVLQFSSWVKHKETHNLKSGYLYLHVLIHFTVTMLIVWDWSFWWLALLISLSHLFIDALKIYATNKTGKQQAPFFIDQALHIIILFVVAYYGNIFEVVTNTFQSISWEFVVAILFVTLPSSIIINKLLTGWNEFMEDNTNSLPNAGKYIGIIERLFVLAFILTNHWEGIGFLITAKSVFRFNDLKANNRKLTEYILIGTLLSFGIAIVIGLLTKMTFY